MEEIFKTEHNLATQAVYKKNSVPVAQWQSIALALQRLWFQFPGNTHTDNNCITQWCSLRDTQVYAVYPLGKSKDFRIPT